MRFTTSFLKIRLRPSVKTSSPARSRSMSPDDDWPGRLTGDGRVGRILEPVALLQPVNQAALEIGQVTGHALDLRVLDGLDHNVVSDPVRSDLPDDFSLGRDPDKACNCKSCCREYFHHRLAPHCQGRQGPSSTDEPQSEFSFGCGLEPHRSRSQENPISVCCRLDLYQCRSTFWTCKHDRAVAIAWSLPREGLTRPICSASLRRTSRSRDDAHVAGSGYPARLLAAKADRRPRKAHDHLGSNSAVSFNNRCAVPRTRRLSTLGAGPQPHICVTFSPASGMYSGEHTQVVDRTAQRSGNVDLHEGLRNHSALRADAGVIPSHESGFGWSKGE